MSLAYTRRIEQIRRRWWVVLLFTGLAVVAALASLPLHVTYVGKSTLVQSSPGPGADMATMRVTGYAGLFNDPAIQDRLREKARIPTDVKLEARTVPGSAILMIQATADDPEVAQHAATLMAEAFINDINPAGTTSLDLAVIDIEGKFRDLQQAFPDQTAVMNQATNLQAALEAVRNSEPDRLQDLQRQAGVTKIPPPYRQLGPAAAGGLLLGVLAALGMAAVSTRIRSSAELLEKTGLEPLVEVPDARSVRQSRLREDRIRALADIVSSQDSPKPLVIALTDSRGARGAGGIAEALAKVLAQQEYRTVLVYDNADNDASQSAENAGSENVLDNSNLVHLVLEDGDVESLKILPWCGFFASRYSRVTRERIVAVLDELRSGADIIVVAAPSIADSRDAQLLCAAADFTVLVVASQSSRAGDVTSAVEVLGRARADVLGVVLIHGTNGRSAERTISTQRKSSRASEIADKESKESRYPDTSVGSPHR
jgi:polysaccharide biosynthesis transport protein